MNNRYWQLSLFLLVGGVIGWLANGYLNGHFADGGNFEENPTSIPNQQASESVTIPETAQLENNLTGLENSVTVELQSDPEPEAASASKETASIQSEKYNLEDNCIGNTGGNLIHCRMAFLEGVKNPQISESKARQLLESWLLEYPDDIDASFELVDLLSAMEDFVSAAKQLAITQSYQVEPEHIERVATRAQHLARSGLIKLTIKDDAVQHIQLLETLLVMEPNRAAWRYTLSKAQSDLKNYDAALTNLTYILYDPDYGDRANTLYDEINSKLNFAQFAQAPLRKSGSQFLVSGLVNGYGQIQLLLDTGASITTISKSSLEKLGIKTDTGRPLLLNTVGGPVYSNIVTLNSLNIGGQTIANLEVAALHLPGINADGLLGIDYLDQFRFVIDQKKRVLFLTPR